MVTRRVTIHIAEFACAPASVADIVTDVLRYAGHTFCATKHGVTSSIGYSRCYLETDEGIIFRSGLVPRVAQALASEGIQVDYVDRRVAPRPMCKK